MESEGKNEVAVEGHFEMLLGGPGAKLAVIHLRMIEEARAGKPWATEELSGRFTRIPCAGEYLTSVGLKNAENERVLLRVDLVIHSPSPQLFVTAIPEPIAVQHDLASLTKFYEQNFVPATGAAVPATQPRKKTRAAVKVGKR